MKNLSSVGTVITVIACLVFGNALSHWWFNTKSFLDGDLFSPLTVLAVGWLLMLWFVPKRIM